MYDKKMTKEKIYICDLTHTAQGIVSEFVPYGIGCLKSYFYKHSNNRDRFDIKLFKYPEVFNDNFLKNEPKVVGFSNYIWNSDLSYAFAKEIKNLNPNILIIFGGPNYPLEDKYREKWLQSHKSVDIYIVGEGEEPFQKVLDLWYKTQDIEQIKRFGIDGCHALVQGKLFKSNDVVPRLDNIDLFPSPYIEGYLDEFLEDKGLIALNQTNRGCPFTCTYCEKGSGNWTKISSRSVTGFKKEVEYIAKRTEAQTLVIADNNFGMFPQDIKIAKVLAKIKDEYGFPLHIAVSTGKNVAERILKCARILKGSLPVTASVQSLDPEVLKNIKRRNISNDMLLKVAKFTHSAHSSTRSEIILALPGDTKEKHFNTTFQLIDAKMQFVLPYTLILLDGSELSTSISRNKWVMKTKYRLSHRCFGSYKFGERRIASAEIEEVVVGLDSLTFEDYLECRSFDLTVGIFYSDDMLFELLAFLNHFNIKSSYFISAIHERGTRFFTRGLIELYKSFDEATKKELWDDRESLESYIKSLGTMENPDKIVGYNILFRHRALALRELVDDITNVAFNVAYELLDENKKTSYSQFLSELKTYNILRKRNVFDFKKKYTSLFNYNFCELLENGFEGLPKKLSKPIKITFYHTDEQKRLFDGYDTSNLEGIMRILPRLAMIRTHRTLKV